MAGPKENFFIFDSTLNDEVLPILENAITSVLDIYGTGEEKSKNIASELYNVYSKMIVDNPENDMGRFRCSMEQFDKCSRLIMEFDSGFDIKGLEKSLLSSNIWNKTVGTDELTIEENAITINVNKNNGK